MKTSSLLAVAGVALLLAVGVACRDDRPASSSGAVATSSSSGGTSSSGGGIGNPDGGASDAGDPCAPVAQLAQVVQERELNEAAPTPTGGTIVEGTYILNDMNTFVPKDGGGDDPPLPPPTGTYGRSTIRIQGGSMSFARSLGTDPDAMPADKSEVYGFTQNGAKFDLTAKCGTTAGSFGASIMVSATKELVSFHTSRGLESYRLKK